MRMFHESQIRETPINRGEPNRVRAIRHRSEVLGKRWLFVSGAAVMALIVTAVGAIQAGAPTVPASEPETVIIDLVLPGLTTAPAQTPAHPGGPAVGAETIKRIAPRESRSDPPPNSHLRLEEVPESQTAAPSRHSPLPVPLSEPAHEAIGVVISEPSPAVAPTHRVTISRGDSLYLTFKQLGLSQRDLALMTSSKPLKKKLARIAPGQEIEFYLDAESRVTRLVHRLDRIRSLQVLREGDTFTFDEVVEPPDIAVATATGVIDSSLFEAGQHAGLSDNIIMQMAEIFAWDVDFALDIRVGDRFALIFEEQFKGKEKVGEGPIIAAEFTSRGRRIRAVRYVDSTGHSDYFSPHGRSMRKAFLRTPVNFTRISSRFNLKRRHPILHKIRAHRGVDYAAPRGTTVKASGDGKVILAGRKGGYGRTVIVQHGSTYTTLYAHLSRFSKGIRPGKRVRQGQTIGYVGSTGLATGPHLHYEFRVRGVHRDPLKVEFPKAAPLAEKYMADFREKAQPLLAKLDLLDSTFVATAD